MAPASSQMKALIAQFVETTQASERTANKYLKSSNFKLTDAVDSYYSATGWERRKNPMETSLQSQFDSLRDEQADEKDTLELDSTMKYLEQVNVSLENAELFVAIELVQAPTVGEITRQGFVDGWKETYCDVTLPAQSQYLSSLVAQLRTDTSYFRKVYKYAFIAGREKDQKALSKENAVVYWSMLFGKPGWQWKSDNHDWLEHWKAFLEQKWTRSVNKDMWNMILEFAFKSVEDESLSFWSEDGAWPSVIDDFVDWCKQNGISKPDSMDVDVNH